MPNKSTDLILCVDDEPNVLHMFQRTLGRKFKLLAATSATDALALFEQHQPIAVIISDYNMPGMDGLSLLKQVMVISPHTVQIMLTGNINIDVSIEAINETEIFRYLPKPCPTETLQKVTQDALMQYHLHFEKQRLSQELAEMNQALLSSNTLLEKQNYLLATELDTAKTVFRNVVSYQHVALHGLDYCNLPKAEVGGDFLLSFISDDRQSLYLMMGDLTGHGLQSALAVLLVAESFETLGQNKPDIAELAATINHKMCSKLPTELFCAATLIHFDLTAQQLHIRLGGMPDVYVLDQQQRISQTLHSNNLPLGIQADDNFAASVHHYPLNAIKQLFLCSDGVIEQCNAEQQAFGEQRLQTALAASSADQSLVDAVISPLREYQQHAEQSDDISLMAINLPQLLQSLQTA